MSGLIFNCMGKIKMNPFYDTEKTLHAFKPTIIDFIITRHKFKL